MQTTNSLATSAAPAQRPLSVYGRGNKLLGSYNVASDAPVYDYTVPGHGMKTYGMKDTAGQEYYLTDGGNWRNVATKQLQKSMPSWAPAAPATPAPAEAAPAAPAPVVQPTSPTPATWRSVRDFQPKANNLPMPTAPAAKRIADFYPQAEGQSAAYRQEVKTGNQELDRMLAKMGLSGSGTEIERRQAMVDEALARETGRYDDQAKSDLNAYTQSAEQEANRANQRWLSEYDANNAFSIADFNAYQQATQGDMDRELTKDGQQLGAMDTVLNFLATLNPMQYAYPATTMSADNAIELGKTFSSLAMAGGGGGGGGGGGRSSTPAPTAPPPQGFNSTNFFLNTAAQILPSLISAFNK